MQYYMGLDPGSKSGSIAIISEDGKDYQVACMGSSGKSIMTARDISDLIQRLKPKTIKAYLEEVKNKPGEGGNSTWTFSGNYHHLEMALTSHKVRFEKVRPQVWQSYMRCRTGGDKNVSKKKAQEMFPEPVDIFTGNPVKITHSRADALLIAEYGRRFGK
jgi:hypothetical protein